MDGCEHARSDMNEIIESVVAVGPLRDPVLVTGFLVQRRGGRLASSVLSHLLGEWHAELIAKIQPGDFYDFTSLRPQVRISEGKPVIEWPEVLIFLANKEGATRDILLLVGSEPHLRWRTFIEAVADYVEKLGVRLIVNLRSFPAPTPHTRPAPIFPVSSDRELASKFGTPRDGFKFEGLTDITEVLSVQVQSSGCQSVDLSVLQPFYFRPMPRAQASIAWIKALDRAFGGETSLELLEKTADEETRAINETSAENAEMQSMIHELEQRYDSGSIWSQVEPGAQTSELPSGEAVVNEIERLLRESGRPRGSTEE